MLYALETEDASSMVSVVDQQSLTPILKLLVMIMNKGKVRYERYKISYIDSYNHCKDHVHSNNL